MTAVFKALSAEFRDRLRFNVIPIMGKNAPQEMLDIKDKYNVEELPAIVIEQSYNVQDNEVLDKVVNINMGKVSSDLTQLMKFMRTYARKMPKEELEEA